MDLIWFRSMRRHFLIGPSALLLISAAALAADDIAGTYVGEHASDKGADGKTTLKN